MANCQITLKIKDLFPKIESLSLYNLKCLISNGNNISEIYFSNYKKEKYIHQPKVVNSDIIYKIKLINCENSSLIGASELIVPYSIITQINQINPIIYNDQIKLIMDQKTKRKIFGSLIGEESIILSIIIEISLIEENSKKKSSNKIIKKIKNFEEVVQINNRINKKNVKNSTFNKFKSSHKNNNKTLSKNISQNQMSSYAITKENSSKTFLKNSANNTSNNIGSSNLNSENKRKQITNIIINKNGNNKESASTSFMKDSNSKIPTPINKYNKNKFISIDKNYFLLNKNKNYKNKKENKENQENKITNINNIKKDMDMKLFDYNQKMITIVKKNKGKSRKKDRSGSKNIKSAIKSMSSLNIYQNIISNKYLKIKNRSNKIFHASCSSITLNNIRSEKNLSEQNFYKKGKTPKNMGKNNIFFNNLIESKDYKSKTIKKNMSFNTFENKKIRKNKKLNLNEINVKLNDNLLKKNIIINKINNNDNNNSIISKNELLNFQFKSHWLLLNELIRLFHKYKNFIKKNIFYKEKYINEMKKNNAVKNHIIENNSLNFIHLTNSKMNEKIKNLVKIKRLENNIYQKIFDENNNIFNNNFIFVKNGENKVNLIKNDKISLLLILVKNFIKNNGKISQIYNDNEEKKIQLQKLLLKYGINEDQGEYFIKNNFIDKSKDINIINANENNIFDKNIRYKPIFNKDEIKIIKEEEGEDGDNEEDENDTFKKNNLLKQKKVQLKKVVPKIKNSNKIIKNMTPKYKNVTFKFNKKEQKHLKRNFSDINKNQIVVNNIIINNIKDK